MIQLTHAIFRCSVRLELEVDGRDAEVIQEYCGVRGKGEGDDATIISIHEALLYPKSNESLLVRLSVREE